MAKTPGLAMLVMRLKSIGRTPTGLKALPQPGDRGSVGAQFVVQVDAYLHVGTEVGDDLADDTLDLVRQRPTVGVAQHEGRRPSL